MSIHITDEMVERAAKAMITCGANLDTLHMRAAFEMGDRDIARRMLEAALNGPKGQVTR